MQINILDDRLRFPDPLLANAEGLVAIGGDLSAPRLLLAYRSGIFPWTADPVTWWLLMTVTSACVVPLTLPPALMSMVETVEAG